MKKTIFSLLTVVIFLTGCFGPNPPDDLRRYKGIAWAEIPGGCLEYREDVCGLFECMVDRCWCDELMPEPILYEKEGVMIASEEEATAYVQETFKDVEVKRAVKLNNIFFNVFADDNGEEIVYTLAVDGTIIKTTCGV
jgi:hypothetical protein